METLRGRGLQQVRRLGLRKVGDRALRVARAGLNPLWAWLSSPTPMGWPGAGGSQEPKSPSEGCRREGAYWLLPSPLGAQYRVVPSDATFCFGVWKNSISLGLGQ